MDRQPNCQVRRDEIDGEHYDININVIVSLLDYLFYSERGLNEKLIIF